VNGTNGDAGRDASSEEEAWRDLIAHYDLPADRATMATPWPAREDLPDDRLPDPGQPADLSESGGPGETARSAEPPAGPSVADSSAGTGPAGQARVVRHANRVPPPASTNEDAAEEDEEEEEEEEDEHYVPPDPPPLPRLDPVAKGAWVALLGGPAYLLTATILGWPIADWQALAAIVAFIGGFAILVVRMGDGPSRGDDDDHGAVL
jgi:hypothetical protein